MNTKPFNDWIAGFVLGKRIIAVNFFPEDGASFALFFEDNTALYVCASAVNEFRQKGPSLAYGCAESLQDFFGMTLTEWDAGEGMLYRLEAPP